LDITPVGGKAVFGLNRPDGLAVAQVGRRKYWRSGYRKLLDPA